MSAPQVRAKFFVEDVVHSDVPGTEEYASITLRPVFGSYGDGKTNESWSKWTPSGSIQISITNPPAIRPFVKGQCFFVDFTACEPND